MKTVRRTKAAKGERRARRKEKLRDRAADPLSMTPLGGGLFEPAMAEAILGAFQGFDPTGPWSAIAPRIVPVLKRRRHPFPPDAAPLHILVPPGVWTGFGIDLGPAFSHVTAALLEGWGVDHSTLLGTALTNLAGLVERERPRVDAVPVDGVEVTAIQGQGWGSSLILAPELLRPILRSTPRLLLAPVRNILLALPDDVDDGLAMDLWDAVARDAHDELDVEPMRWTGTTVTRVGETGRGLQN